jgi:hypothetical protein
MRDVPAFAGHHHSVDADKLQSRGVRVPARNDGNDRACALPAVLLRLLVFFGSGGGVVLLLRARSWLRIKMLITMQKKC